MSKRIVGVIVLAVSALFSILFAATHDFLPDFVIRESSLAGWRTVGHATWRANNGEITGTPQDQDGGWLVLDKSYQDVQFYTELHCAARCDERSADGPLTRPLQRAACCPCSRQSNLRLRAPRLTGSSMAQSEDQTH